MGSLGDQMAALAESLESDAARRRQFVINNRKQVSKMRTDFANARERRTQRLQSVLSASQQRIKQCVARAKQAASSANLTRKQMVLRTRREVSSSLLRHNASRANLRRRLRSGLQTDVRRIKQDVARTLAGERSSRQRIASEGQRRRRQHQAQIRRAVASNLLRYNTRRSATQRQMRSSLQASMRRLKQNVSRVFRLAENDRANRHQTIGRIRSGVNSTLRGYAAARGMARKSLSSARRRISPSSGMALGGR